MRAKYGRKPPPWPTPLYSSMPPSSVVLLLTLCLTPRIFNFVAAQDSDGYVTSNGVNHETREHETAVKWTCPDSKVRELVITVNSSSTPLTLLITEAQSRQFCRTERVVSSEEELKIPDGQCGITRVSPFSLWVDVRRFVDVDTEADFEFNLSCPANAANAPAQPARRRTDEADLLRLKLIPIETLPTAYPTTTRRQQRHEVIFGRPHFLMASLRRTKDDEESNLPTTDSDRRSVSPHPDGEVTGFRIHSCSASSPMRDASLEMTNGAGCSLHPSLIGDFTYGGGNPNETHWTATAEIRSMFRFRSSDIVQIRCQYELCRENSRGCSKDHMKSAFQDVRCSSQAATTESVVAKEMRHRREVVNFTEESGSGEEGDDQPIEDVTESRRTESNLQVERLLNSATTESQPYTDYSIETQYSIPPATSLEPLQHASDTPPLEEAGDFSISDYSVEINATYATSSIPTTTDSSTTFIGTSPEPSTTTPPVDDPFPSAVVVVHVVDEEAKEYSYVSTSLLPDLITPSPRIGNEEAITATVQDILERDDDTTTVPLPPAIPSVEEPRARRECNSTEYDFADPLQMYGMSMEVLFKVCIVLCFIFIIGCLGNLLICCCLCGKRRQRAERHEGKEKRRSAMTSSSTYSFSGLSTPSGVHSSQVVTSYHSSTAPRNWRLANGNKQDPPSPQLSNHLNKRLSGHESWVNGVYGPSRPEVSFYGGQDQQMPPAPTKTSRRASTNSFASVKQRASTLQPYNHAAQPLPSGGLLQYVGNSRSPNRSSTSTLGTSSTTPIGNVSLGRHQRESSLSHGTGGEEAGEGTLRPTRLAPPPPISEQGSDPRTSSIHQSSPSTRTSSSGSSANNTNPLPKLLSDAEGHVGGYDDTLTPRTEQQLRMNSFTGAELEGVADKETTPLSSFSSSSHSRSSRTTPLQEVQNQGYEGSTIQLNNHEAYSIL